MAETTKPQASNVTSKTNTTFFDTDRSIDGEESEEFCSICLQSYVQPVKLPCSHIFCFLCIKGFAMKKKQCALCRKEVPQEYFKNPIVIGSVKAPNKKKELFWYYEGNRGWWQYDERSSKELEEQFQKKKEKKFEMLIAGSLYIIDLENMHQKKSNENSRSRKIKRELVDSVDILKGIAGLKLTDTMRFGDRKEADGGTDT